ncbi:hypothetical protein GRF59_05785 [Paenibacillus sp. HJL G12]|uniref:Uncharacterized protein n=1 Tax=Paenibacillus dendrobii TaxID=2691084 RepID=A0A7X3IG02_9BACL|nr:hypothetical protein [Paenibacillus dendrobii]MWV43135.1 hypothetical protein [Paenibacillus dendrobii]
MDTKAKKILLDTHWKSGVWRSGGFSCSHEDFQYAKSKGLMFDPLTMTHDECIRKLHELHANVMTKERVVTAFLHSLSTRKVYLRSALSSWALTQALPLHTYNQQPAEQAGYSACGYCNEKRIMSNEQYMNEDLNVLNFERIKWGGVRLNWLVYCLMDLECLRQEEELTVQIEDIEILRQMIQAIEDCGDKDAARQLEKRWKQVLPSNQHERDSVLEIWGYAGLLESKDDYRKERGRGTDFMSMATWRGEDGYSRDMLEYYFGPFL